jgi:menaquinone-specific isochorismate synthase
MTQLDSHSASHAPTPAGSPLLEHSLAILRHAIEQPHWDDRLVRVEAQLPLPAPGLLPSLFDSFAMEDAVYWAQPDGTTTVGLGCLAVLTAEGEARFATLREAATSLPRWATLFAGFSFRAGDGGFGDARAIVPLLTLRSDGNACSITLGFDREHHDEATRERLRALIDELAARWRTSTTNVSALPAERVAEADAESERYVAAVDAARTHIRQGALAKVMLHCQTPVHTRVVRAPGAVLRSLDRRHPESTRFAFRVDGVTFLGATPERLVRRRDRHIAADVLAGSLPRSQGDDRAVALLNSSKDLSEHELTRRSIADVLGPRCVSLEQDGPRVLTLPNVHHLHTALQGVLRSDEHVLSLVEALHPTPAVGGVPRAEAMTYIAEHEPASRGWYAAPVGWFTPDGDGDFAVALRCAKLNGHEVTLYAGAGIVADSDPRSELLETRSKRRAMAGALAIELTPIEMHDHGRT